MGKVEAAPPAVSERAKERTWAHVDWAAWRESGRVVFVTRLAFFALAYAAVWMLADDTDGRSTTGFLDMWRQWDAVHFTDIADRGYFAPETHPQATAFFPLYPLMIDAITRVGIPSVLAGLIISAGASVVAGAFLNRLAEAEVGEGAGRRALLYLFLFPTAVFLAAPYSEALFLAGAIPAFYYARRGRWHLVGLPAAVAMGARAAGVFLLLGLAVEFVRQRDFRLERVAAGAGALAIGALPLIAYGIFLWNSTGTPVDFIAAQKEGWGRDLTSPIQSFVSTWNTWEGAYTTNWLFAWRVEILAAMAGLFFTGWAFARREWSYGVYMLATLAALMTSTWYFSIPRLLLTLFPIAILLAGFSHGQPRRHENLVMVLAPLSALGVIVFTQGIWFF